MEDTSKKAHNFKKEYFGVPTWCFICKDFIWGITKGQQKGFKCQDCHGSAHKKCLDRAEKCEPPHSLRNSQKPEKPPKTREQTQEKIERKQQRQQQNCTFPLPPVRGERTLQTLVLEVEVTVEVVRGKLMYFPGQSITNKTRADVSAQYAAIAQKCTEGYFPAYIQPGGARQKMSNAVKPFNVSPKFESIKRIFLQRDVQYNGAPLELNVVRVPFFIESNSQSNVNAQSVFKYQANTQGESNSSGTENILPIVAENYKNTYSKIILNIKPKMNMAQEGWKLNCFEIVQQGESSTKLDIGDLFEGKLSGSFKGCMDLFFTRYSPQPLPLEFGSLYIIAKMNVQANSRGMVQTQMASSVQYELGLEALQEQLRPEGWSILGLALTGEMVGGGQTNATLFVKQNTQSEVGAGFLVLLQRGFDTPKNPLIVKVTTQTEMQTGMMGATMDSASTDAAIDAYGAAGYKPLVILVSGTSMAVALR